VPDAPVGGGGTAATPDGPGTSPNYSDAPPADDATSAVEMGRGTPDAGIGGATNTEVGITTALDGLDVAETPNASGYEIDLTPPAFLDRRARA
jgi:hypothetical protein